MLVLSRRKDQTILLTVPPSSTPTVIAVTHLGMRGGATKLGISAPREVRVVREELEDRGSAGEQADSQQPKADSQSGGHAA